MRKALMLNRRTLAFLILLILGSSLLIYFIYPYEAPSAPQRFSYGVTVYDVISEKAGIPAKNITVILEGLTTNYNSSLKSPNLRNETYYFANLTSGNYLLKIYSSYGILLYNKTINLVENKLDTVTLRSQPFIVSVTIGGKPSPFTYKVTMKNLEYGYVFNETIQAQSTATFTQIPLGNYSISLYYLGFEINRTSLNINASLNFYTFKTYVVNATFGLLDEKGNLLNQTKLYLEHNSKSIGPFLPSSNSTLINAINLPPLKFNVTFEYKGINVTLKENPLVDLTSNDKKSFNFTTYLGNLTVKVSYDDGRPAKGLSVALSPLLGGILGVEGNQTFTNIPANVALKISVEDTFLEVLQKEITIVPNFNNSIELIIPKHNLNINLVGNGDISSFKIFFVVQNNFNKSIVYRINSYSLNIQLYPAVYRVFAYVYSYSNNTILLYSEYLALNKTIVKDVNVSIGYSIVVNTSYPDDEIIIYYVDFNGDFLVAKNKGNSVLVNNLIPGDYKIVVLRDGKYVASEFVVINMKSPQRIQINIDTTTTDPLFLVFQSAIPVLFVLFLLLFLATFFAFKLYRKRKMK